jgi:hypothetical protein
VARDDIVELMRPERTDQYAITQIQIVSPGMFYYIGDAPQPYIVTASYQISNRADERVVTNSISTGKCTKKKEKQDEVN